MIQQDDYLPFGYELSIGSVISPGNKYLYNKKELQTELGQYDYGARFYDPVIARWTSVDPLVEAGQESMTPYGYTFDDPVRYTDPDGRAPEGNNGCCDALKNYAREYMRTAVMVSGPYAAMASKRSPQEALSNTGDALVFGGYAGAAFTDGASLELVPLGEKFQTAASAWSVGSDLMKGNDKNAAITTVSTIAFGAAGSRLEGLERVGKLSSVQKPILGAMLSVTEKLADIGTDKLKEEKKEGKSEKKADKRMPDNEHNKKATKYAQDFFKKREEDRQQQQQQ
ncbi:RHS repeat-associated core domain-containing protein [Mucilaginibacter panaciglaebae]|uniref:RHS repeat-associated protein n=1 Tax=Mucilaginibacter panaciglaebae TaxID=502331 RepID=A0ABP7WP55_9SPHI